MPLYKSIAVDQETHVLIWEITESEKELREAVELGSNSTQRLQSMKSELHRRGYLSVRHLLAIAQYTDSDLSYSVHGKPMLSDGVEISITHSYEYAAIILSSKPVGIDIEKQRHKITLIANKFVSPKEDEYLMAVAEKIKAFTIIWGAKEAIYKLYGEKGLSFKQHIDVAPFQVSEPQTKASVNYHGGISFYEVTAFEFKGFTCVFVC